MQQRTRTTRRTRWTRRGVVSVLAMMFLILFGSLAAAMAIVSTGNLRTATAHLHVMRAMGAAETGLAVAEQRIAEAAARFVVEKGEVDQDFGWRIWTGSTTSGDGEVQVLGPRSGHPENTTPSGIAQALANYHAADSNIVVIDGLSVPVIGPAPTGTDDDEYKLTYWVTTPAVPIPTHGTSASGSAPVFQITYAPLANGTDIRAVVTGFDFDHARNGLPLTRVLVKDFRIVKRVNHAVVSPTRIMIGKNVLIEGDLGARYMDVDVPHGHPVIIRSDFQGLDSILDEKIADLFDSFASFDVDGDNRLRVDHSIEGQGIPSQETDYDDDGDADEAFSDVTGDGYLDEFDVFIKHFDANDDGRITLSSALTEGTPAQGMSPELVGEDGTPLDEELSLLIDSAMPDRNRNGVYGYVDIDGDGFWDAGSEPLNDYDAYSGTFADQVLGYRDGFIDRKDLYSKVRGKLMFTAVAGDWAAAQGDFIEMLRGPIRPGPGEAPMTFGADETDLPDVSAADFSNSETALRSAANGVDFWQQVASQLGLSVSQLNSYNETSTDPTDVRYYRLDADGDGDGLPDNHETAYYEKMPFNSPTHVDWYYRPVFENMVFKDVQIPQGVNGLFRNCTFAGVTWIRTHEDNSHVNWTLYGKLKWDADEGHPVTDAGRTIYSGSDYPPVLPPSALPPYQALLIADPPLDKGDVPEDQIAFIANYAELPEPLLVNGNRVINSKHLSNNIRFHDCLFVGTVVSDAPTGYTHVRNKLQFTGATRFVAEHPTSPDDPSLNPENGDLEEIAKSTMMLPNYSVDIGSFNSPPEQDVKLRGAVIAGVLDVRGNASIDGALLLTFKPELGVKPLVDIFGNPIGSPAGFNTTFGYFGPEDGDGESLDPNSLPMVDGVRIVGWDLDGDGLADLGPDETPTDDQLAAGAETVPFHGYGRVNIRFDPDMIMPDGVMLPLQSDPLPSTYSEGKPW